MTNVTLWEKGLRPLVLFIIFGLCLSLWFAKESEQQSAHTSKHK